MTQHLTLSLSLALSCFGIPCEAIIAEEVVDLKRFVRTSRCLTFYPVCRPAATYVVPKRTGRIDSTQSEKLDLEGVAFLNSSRWNQSLLPSRVLLAR